MKTLKDLKNLYGTTLLPDLEVLEGERRKIAKKLIGIGLGVLGTVILIIAFFFNQVNDKMALFIFPGVIGMIVFGSIYQFLTKGYVKEFKGKIIQRIVSFLDENLNYNASGCIPQSQFVGCRIFKRSPDRYKGDDRVQGKLESTQIEFSEIHAEYKT